MITVLQFVSYIESLTWAMRMPVSAASFAQMTTPSAVVSVAPIILPSSGLGRGLDVQLRASVPATGSSLPIILFSHGNGQSLHAYGPLADYWASHGFCVLQPTHLDSRTLGISADDPRRRQFWRHREEDLLRILDGLDELEASEAGAPILQGRLDRTRIAVAGHSWGGQTASVFLGATHPDPDSPGTMIDRKDDRVKAGVLFAVPGNGGKDLSELGAKMFPFMHPNFSGMTTATLIVAGDKDQGHLTSRGSDWWRDAYDLSPSANKALFTAFGGEHALGGLPGYESREATDERPQRVEVIQRLSTAFLRSALYPGEDTWDKVVAEVNADAQPEGRIENK